MKIYLLFFGLLITFCSYGGELKFDWDLLKSDTSIKNKYDHIISVHDNVYQTVGKREIINTIFPAFYAWEIDHGRNVEKLNILKEILESFQGSDVKSKCIIALLYYYEDAYKLQETLLQQKGDESLESLKKIYNAQNEYFKLKSQHIANKLFVSACVDHYFFACFMLYFNELGKLLNCRLFNSNDQEICNKLIYSVVKYENRLLEEAIYNYKQNSNSLIKDKAAFIVFSIYKHGAMPVLDSMINVKSYGFTRDIEKAKYWGSLLD